jgi:hypothetical protein
VCLGQFKSDLRPLMGITGQLQRFFQPGTCRLPAGEHLRRGSLAQQRDPLGWRGRLGERSRKQVGACLRRPALDRRPRGLAQARDHKGVTDRLDPHQVGGHSSGRRPISMEQASGSPVAGVPFVIAH